MDAFDELLVLSSQPWFLDLSCFCSSLQLHCELSFVLSLLSALPLPSGSLRGTEKLCCKASQQSQFTLPDPGVEILPC